MTTSNIIQVPPTAKTPLQGGEELSPPSKLFYFAKQRVTEESIVFDAVNAVAPERKVRNDPAGEIDLPLTCE